MHYYGIDVHKHFCAFTCMDESGQVVRRGKAINSRDELVGMVSPSAGDAVAVMEATGNWGFIYDTLEASVDKMLLAHPLMVRAIASAKVRPTESTRTP